MSTIAIRKTWYRYIDILGILSMSLTAIGSCHGKRYTPDADLGWPAGHIRWPHVTFLSMGGGALFFCLEDPCHWDQTTTMILCKTNHLQWIHSYIICWWIPMHSHWILATPYSYVIVGYCDYVGLSENRVPQSNLKDTHAISRPKKYIRLVSQNLWSPS